MNSDKKIEVAVYLADPDVAKWMAFQQFYDPFTLLVAADVFTQKNARISLNFDKDGILQTIQREDFLYSRRHAQ
jgi:hypothetical protein